jgi:ABC-type sugar transport system ATPase subunit
LYAVGLLLRVTNVIKRYGGAVALRNAHLELRRGEVHALIGENGAGKSTLAKIIAGSVRPDHATIEIDGKPVRITNPMDAQRLGIGIIYQELDLFPHLTVAENLVIGNLHFSEGAIVNRRRMEAFCRPFLEQVGLDRGLGEKAADLPVGHRQLLAIARALSMNARILLMDEPTSSLSEEFVERLFGLIRRLKAQDVSVVYVSHKMEEMFRISDRITVLRDGETVGTLETAAATPAEVIRLMVGRTLALRERVARKPGDVLLRVENLTTRKLRGISFALRQGEVLGIAGLVGAGRSELGAALCGFEQILAGEIQWSEPGAAPAGSQTAISLLPEDRREQGLMMRRSVIENATLGALGRFTRFGFILRRREAAALDPIARKLRLACPSWNAAVSTLSGGNQQKVLLARLVLVNPGILFLDEPTRGIDVAAKQDIYRIIDDLAAEGKGLILVSSELGELLQCCDRILVLSEGRATAIYEAHEASQEKIMAAATR